MKARSALMIRTWESARKFMVIARLLGSMNSTFVKVSVFSEIWHSSTPMGRMLSRGEAKETSRRRSKITLPLRSAILAWPSGVESRSARPAPKSLIMVVCS